MGRGSGSIDAEDGVVELEYWLEGGWRAADLQDVVVDSGARGTHVACWCARYGDHHRGGGKRVGRLLKLLTLVLRVSLALILYSTRHYRYLIVVANVRSGYYLDHSLTAPVASSTGSGG